MNGISGKQRDAIRTRDDNECQAPFPHRCHGKLEVHHILPRGYCERIGLPEEMVNEPTNLLTICENAHSLIHPDRFEALKLYGADKVQGIDSFAEMKRLRETKMNQYEIYWVAQWDRHMTVIARKRTFFALKNGWSWPERK